MNVDAVMALAVKHLGSGMESSARVALADAVELRDAYKYEDARNRALRSLQYSVGVFHPDYQRAARGVPA